MTTENFLTPKEISDRLRLRSTTVYRLIREEMPFLRIGRTIRVRPEDFNAWLKTHEHGTPITLDFDAMQRDLDAATLAAPVSEPGHPKEN